MTDWQSRPAATLGEVTLSLHGLLTHLHRRARLRPLLQEAVVEQFLADHAARAGLTVAAEELQQAADDFRRRQGLTSAEATHAWLARERLSAQDLEDALERDLLIAKLRERLTAERVPDHFAAHKAGFDRARLRHVVLPRQDVARELATQVREEGRDFDELARQHVPGYRGATGWVRRRQLPPPLADAVFAAAPGEVVGPVATGDGFHLALVEEVRPAELDADTAALVREELFRAWLSERLREAPLTFPLLDALA